MGNQRPFPAERAVSLSGTVARTSIAVRTGTIDLAVWSGYNHGGVTSWWSGARQRHIAVVRPSGTLMLLGLELRPITWCRQTRINRGPRAMKPDFTASERTVI